MGKGFRRVSTAALALAVVACGKGDGGNSATAAREAAPTPKLGIRPNGDTTLTVNTRMIHNADLPRIYDYIDSHIDAHVVNLQKWIQQPSISNTGEGIQESAEMVKGFFDQLGCQQTKVYDVGKTRWGQQGNPVVYAKCDEGAKKTLVIYWMYDTMPVTQPDLWKAPPFEGRLVEQAPYKKVLIGRGAVNSKGPEMAMLNALMSIKAVTGKLPVNLIFVAEGDEERMSMGYNQFVTTHPELFKAADAMYTFGFSGPGGGGVLSGSEGCVFVELTTSGKSWGRGPVYSDIHGGNMSKLVSPDGNTVLIPGFYDDIEPLAAEKDAQLRAQAKTMDIRKAAEGLGVARYISDDPYQVLKMARYGTSMNLDGIWGGNMFAGGSGAILPNKITSKHNFRYVPNMSGPDIVAKLRRHLDRLGYNDVEINLVGDVPWAKRNTDNDIGRAVYAGFEQFGVTHPPISSLDSIMGGYWPAYLFAGNGAAIDIPIVGGMLGFGGNSHAANEYYVIEGAGKTYGMAGAEKSVAAILYNYAGLNGPVVLSNSVKPN